MGEAMSSTLAVLNDDREALVTLPPLACGLKHRLPNCEIFIFFLISVALLTEFFILFQKPGGKVSDFGPAFMTILTKFPVGLWLS